MPRSKSNIVVVLGKSTINKIEYDPLVLIGRALARRGKTLFTTNTPGAPKAIVDGYTKEGGTPTYIGKGGIPGNADEVLIFTDARYQAKLDERDPKWRDNGWLIFHNRKATTEAAAMVTQILEELGAPLDGGEE